MLYADETEYLSEISEGGREGEREGGSTADAQAWLRRGAITLRVTQHVTSDPVCYIRQFLCTVHCQNISADNGTVKLRVTVGLISSKTVS